MEKDLFDWFAEYSGVAAAELRRAAAHYGAVNRLHWEECPGETWEERARSFYRIADGYVLDLLNANRSREHLVRVYQHFGHWDWFLRSGHEVLEFGGGLGLACSIFRELGRKVTYVDVDGVASRFARWFFERTGQTDIETILTPVECLDLPVGRQWDFVFSDAVLEHVTDATATVDTLARAVRPGGILYLIVDAHNVGPDFPMHRHVYLDELLAGSETLARMEHLVHDGDGYNVFRQPALAPAR